MSFACDIMAVPKRDLAGVTYAMYATGTCKVSLPQCASGLVGVIPSPVSSQRRIGYLTRIVNTHPWPI